MIVRAYGLYWSVTGVDWDGKQMLGADSDEPASARITNAWKQSGVYVLYDEYMPIYVGRAVVENLGDRVDAHRFDRLAGRWDTFSWFGTHRVNKDGTLQAYEFRNADRENIVKSLEAFALIAFDPRLNRRHEYPPEAEEFVQRIERPKATRTLIEEIHSAVIKTTNPDGGKAT